MSSAVMAPLSSSARNEGSSGMPPGAETADLLPDACDSLGLSASTAAATASVASSSPRYRAFIHTSKRKRMTENQCISATNSENEPVG